MSTNQPRVYAARLVGLHVFDPNGDQVGRVRDVVVTLRSDSAPPRVLGLVVEVIGRRRIFLPMTRVTAVDGGHVITTGLVNMRRFEQRSSETLVIGEMLDRHVSIADPPVSGTVFDIGLEQQRTRDWMLTKVAVAEPGKRFGRRGQTHVVAWADVTGLTSRKQAQGATHLLAAFDEMRAADLANALHSLPPKRRAEIADALSDDRLADVLEELPEDDQVQILGALESERAADVLEEMSPDDAADLVGQLSDETAEQLLQLMEPDEADDVRRLLAYAEHTAGSLMTTDPVILPPDATIADALAHIRQRELSPSLASMVYICRAPLETPTGRYLGVAHFQRLLREPPSSLVSGVLDSDLEVLRAEASTDEVMRHMAYYNNVSSPIVDENQHLLGVVTVDDLMDHLLPDDWRETSFQSPGPSVQPKDTSPGRSHG